MSLYEEIENSFPVIEKLFSKEDLLEFKNTDKKELCLYHFGLGLWIRNNLLYPNKNNLRDLFLADCIMNEDDMSAIVIQFFHQHMFNKL